MNPSSSSLSVSLLLLVVVVLLPFPPRISAHLSHETFIGCISLGSAGISGVIHTRNDSSFSSILSSTIQNRRFSTPEIPKPLIIITPLEISQVRDTVICSRKHGLEIRTRSGGHDYEGLSYLSNNPFVLLDLRNLRSITVDVEDRTAWVQSGATIGELYHEIARKSPNLAFPAGVYPTVGVGGHFSGGGYGTLVRKHGLAVDNMVDATIVDAKGRLLDRESMGEDLFWAIRGGGGASFGVIIAWKIVLVRVPSSVIAFNVRKRLDENATELIHRWQYVAAGLTEDLFLRIVVKRSNSGRLEATFPSLYLRSVDELLELMKNKFPELGLKKEDCMEITWIQSVLYFSGHSIREPISVLAKRATDTRSFKAKSDYVQDPMPKSAIEEIWRRLEAPEAKLAKFILTPFGGKMSEIAEFKTPFPHRAGVLYEIQHLVYWKQEENAESEKYIRWVETLYDFVTPYVPNSPRAAYCNFRDLDLGRNEDGKTRYEDASVWGTKYFKNNFEKLVRVKTRVDPTDFFKNEQSIPSLYFLDVI